MTFRTAVVVALVVTAAGCGGKSSSTPDAPSPPPSTTITITTAGVSPKSVTVPAGSQVQFINDDRVAHQMASNPHPEHTDCPEINAVGFLNPNQSRQTGNLNTVRTCGFHDHDNPNNTALQGTIVIR